MYPHRLLAMVTLLLAPVITYGQGDKKKDEQDASKVAAAKVQIGVLTQACQAYKVKHEKYPDTLEELTKTTPPFVEKSALLDPWKKQYLYVRDGVRNKGKMP